MGLHNENTREIHLKIVYWGAWMSGKTENIVKLSEMFKDAGRLVTLMGEDGTTIYFDFLNPIVTLKNGYKIKYLLYASPGKKALILARELVISGTDGIVFVVDSDKTRLKDNLESFSELRNLIESHGTAFSDIPLIFQYNKRDLSTALPIEELRNKLNKDNYPEVEAEAINGKGVFETFKEIAKLSLKNFIIKSNLSELEYF